MGMQFARIYEFLPNLQLDGDFLEIGTECGENSTFIFASLAKIYNKTLYTVDIDEIKINSIQSKIKALPFELPVKFNVSSGENFLDNNADLKISIAVLDNFDWTWNPESIDQGMLDQIVSYKNRFNIEMNNLNSQVVHLMQAIKLAHMLTNDAIVVCDDTFWIGNHGMYFGKCSSAIPFLISQGFTPINDNAGVFMVRKRS